MKQFIFLLETTDESCIFSDPDAVFLGFEKTSSLLSFLSLFNFIKFDLDINPSPLTSKLTSLESFSGRVLIVIALFDMSSPFEPSPRVSALLNNPFSYDIDRATPSYLSSQR